jgi:hypothetical protein
MITSMTIVIISGMHRPSDVYGAPVLSVAWALCLTSATEHDDRETRDRLFGAASRLWCVCAAIVAVVGAALGSESLRSTTSAAQPIPAQEVINRTAYGAALIAVALALLAGVAAYEILGPAEPLTPSRSDRSPTRTGSG